MKIWLFGILLALAVLGAAPAHAGCPDGFAEVPAYSPYSGQAYCVMEDEAVNPATGEPWNYISMEDAVEVCAILVPQGDLPVNAIWQAILRQAEGVASNWTGGSVGSGTLKTDLALSNGSTFLNIGEGFWEFVIGQSPSDWSAGEISDLTAGDSYSFTINGLTGNGKYHFGPSGTYSASAELGVTTNRYSSKIMRGGDNLCTPGFPCEPGYYGDPGAFGAAMNHNGEAASDVGFRCTCPKSACGS